jgi:hypothetical protein
MGKTESGAALRETVVGGAGDSRPNAKISECALYSQLSTVLLSRVAATHGSAVPCVVRVRITWAGNELCRDAPCTAQKTVAPRRMSGSGDGGIWVVDDRSMFQLTLTPTPLPEYRERGPRCARE